MTAKEMFEELEYECRINEYSITYIKRTLNYEGICFYLNDKTFYKQIEYDPGDITLDELQAINKQVEELGWNKGSEE